MDNFRFKKRYGQNFLKNQDIIEQITNSISPTPKDLIVEIGPGGGAITRKLKKYGSRLVAIEIDEETKPLLNPLEDEKTSIKYADFLEIDLNKFLNDYSYEKLYMIGNLPYYITTPIIEHIIDSRIPLESLTIMVQKEVADRFLAIPGTKEYGYMTVLLNYHFDIKKITDVSKKDFEPMPKVDSTVIKLIKKEEQDIDYDRFKQFFKDSFKFKRKTLNNNLKAYNREKIQKVLEDNGFSLSNRAEEIDLKTFIDIIKNW